MFKNKLIPDSAIRDEIIRYIQPFTATPISPSAHVVIVGDKEADTYNLFISDRASGQNVYADSDGGVMVETFERAPALV